MKFLLTILLTLVSMLSISAQNPDLAAEQIERWERPDSALSFLQPVVSPVLPDSADVRRLEHKAFWRASAEVVGMNLGLWAFDRYIQHGQFAYISWNSIKENFKHGFEWDNDHLSTNMFAHPYNGSLFYNAGRSNGYNYWQSALFAIGGSAMWEMFMEKEYPSTNDIIATPIGGAALGEVLYRTSDLVIDDRTGGWERAGREIAGFLISPMKGFTRIVTGRAWHRRPTTGRRFGIPPVGVSFSLGSRMLLFHDERTYNKAGLTGRVFIEYGNKFEESTRYPFDYFTFLLDADVMPTQPILSRVEIMGRLLSKVVYESKSADISLGMYQHFDFFDSDTISNGKPNSVLDACLVPYKLGTPASLGGGMLARYSPNRKWQLEGYAHVNAVFLAGILSDFYRRYHRNYNWGSGFALKGGVSINYPSIRFQTGIDVRFYRIYTLKGYKFDEDDRPEYLEPNVQGDRSNASFLNLNYYFNYRLIRNLYATISLDWYRRYSHYPEITLRIPENDPTGYPHGFAAVGGPIFTSDQIGLKIMLTYNM